MTTIAQQYQAGLFATLAYANYASAILLTDTEARKTELIKTISIMEEPNSKGKDIRPTMNDKYLTGAQAIDFAVKYDVVDWVSDTQGGSDFQAVVFQERNTNQYEIKGVRSFFTA